MYTLTPKFTKSYQGRPTPTLQLMFMKQALKPWKIELTQNWTRWLFQGMMNDFLFLMSTMSYHCVGGEYFLFQRKQLIQSCQWIGVDIIIASIHVENCVLLTQIDLSHELFFWLFPSFFSLVHVRNIAFYHFVYPKIRTITVPLYFLDIITLSLQLHLFSCFIFTILLKFCFCKLHTHTYIHTCKCKKKVIMDSHCRRHVGDDSLVRAGSPLWENHQVPCHTGRSSWSSKISS